MTDNASEVKTNEDKKIAPKVGDSWYDVLYETMHQDIAAA